MKNLTARRDEIVEAALPHISFDGWTVRALKAGAADRDLGSDEVGRAFAGGVNEAMAQFSDLADRWMIADLSARGTANLPIHEIIALAVRLRLERLVPHREAVRRALAALSLPGRQLIATRCTYRTVDAIWRAAGDRSTDFNFYTKRGLLAGVYTATILYWLGDDSTDFEKTWRFLDARIADVVKTIQTRRRLTKAVSDAISRFRPRRAAFGG